MRPSFPVLLRCPDRSPDANITHPILINQPQNLAASSETGSATVIISGLSLGMLSTVAPVIIDRYFCSCKVISVQAELPTLTSDFTV